MRHLHIILFFLLSPVILWAQDAKNYQWLIEGMKAGEGILYRPQDYIEKEHNFSALFIAAEEGKNVVSPCDGTVISYGLHY